MAFIQVAQSQTSRDDQFLQHVALCSHQHNVALVRVDASLILAIEIQKNALQLSRS